MKNWKALKSELLKNAKVKHEYKKMQPRYQIVSQLIEARIKRGLTQEKLAKEAGTKQSAIARLESGNSNPSLEFLEKVVNALNSKLIIQIK